MSTYIAPIDRVRDALEDVGCSPKRNTARCPAHDDRNPSLTFNEGDDGRALVYCHAGCRLDEILGALGLESKDLFMPDDDWRRPMPTRTTKPQVSKPQVARPQAPPDLRLAERCWDAAWTYTALAADAHDQGDYEADARFTALAEGKWRVVDRILSAVARADEEGSLSMEVTDPLSTHPDETGYLGQLIRMLVDSPSVQRMLASQDTQAEVVKDAVLVLADVLRDNEEAK